MNAERIHLAGLNKEELVDFVSGFGEPAFRATQLFRGIHQRRLVEFGEFTDISNDFRDTLSGSALIRTLKPESQFISKDGTRRYLFLTNDGHPVETVFIPSKKRDTICFSSQSGCALDCSFCLTAKLGFLKNLSPGEIVEQVLFVLNEVYGIGCDTPHGTNLVAMGAGEPFLNFSALMKAVELMASSEGLFIVPNRITVSTAGIVPKIHEFAKLDRRPHLAISLSAPNDEIRSGLMPINNRWSIGELLTAAKEFERSLRKGERFTFEYVLLAGVNDQPEHARELVELMEQYDLRRVKINLIPHNSADQLEFASPPAEKVAVFKQILEDGGLSAYVRRARGDDIFAACGQLAAQ